MTVIRISQAQAGQIINNDIVDRSGRVLISANTELRDDTLKVLKSWGVVELDIVGDVASADCSDQFKHIDPAILQATELDLANRFRFLNRNHVFIEELFTICLRRELNQMEANNGG